MRPRCTHSGPETTVRRGSSSSRHLSVQRLDFHAAAATIDRDALQIHMSRVCALAALSNRVGVGFGRNSSVAHGGLHVESGKPCGSGADSGRGNRRSAALRRMVNTSLLRSVEAGLSGPIEVFCECGRRACANRVPIDVAVYESVLNTPGHHVVTTRHDEDGTQRLVSRHHGFLVVERGRR